MELAEQIRELVGNDDKVTAKILNILKSETDRAVTKGIATFQEKSLPGLLDQELKKKAETDREFQLSLKEKAIELSAETNIPYKVILRNLKGDESEDNEAIQDLQELVSKAKIEKATELQMRGGGLPQVSGEAGIGQLSASDLAKMKPKDVVQAMNAGLCNRILGRS